MADREALSTAYRDIVAVLRDLSAEEEWLPTGCAGWSVRDLLFHLRGDAQRALVALASPAGTEPDTDAVSYWTHWRPDTDGALLNRRMTRICASVYSGLRPILDSFAETTEAVVYAAVNTDPGLAVRTQGHVLRAGDLVRTWWSRRPSTISTSSSPWTVPCPRPGRCGWCGRRSTACSASRCRWPGTM
jgi:hypothetical protein